MENKDDPLKPSGISRKWSQYHHTFFSRIEFPTGKTIDSFYDHINDGMRNETLTRLVKADRIRLKIVAIVFGDADAMIVWQAKDAEAAQAFRDIILAGDRSVTLTAMTGDGHDG